LAKKFEKQPPDWDQQRRRWDFLNLVRVILIGLAFVALLMAFRGLTRAPLDESWCLFEDFQFFLSHDPKHFGGVGAVSARSRMDGLPTT
jgi:hypothetical protein